MQRQEQQQQQQQQQQQPQHKLTCDGGGDDLEEDCGAERQADLLPLQLHGHVEDGEQAEQRQRADRDEGAHAGANDPGCRGEREREKLRR